VGYAKGTQVPVSKSRGQIDKLLRDWGAQGVQWTDEWGDSPKVTLRFIWDYKETPLSARFTLEMDDEAIREESCHLGTGQFLESKYERLRTAWAAEAHRLLFQFLKMALHAVEAGLIPAETIFMPWFEDQSGRTVADVLMPRLEELSRTSATRLLVSG